MSFACLIANAIARAQKQQTQHELLRLIEGRSSSSRSSLGWRKAKLTPRAHCWEITPKSLKERVHVFDMLIGLKTSFPKKALEKAESAYPTVEPLRCFILAFQARPEYRFQCYERLQIASPSVVVNGLYLLAKQFELPLFERTTLEQ
mgnify:CR=1 FL=1